MSCPYCRTTNGKKNLISSKLLARSPCIKDSFLPVLPKGLFKPERVNERWGYDYGISAVIKGAKSPVLKFQLIRVLYDTQAGDACPMVQLDDMPTSYPYTFGNEDDFNGSYAMCYGFEMEELCGQSIFVNYCPICGRKLTESDNA